MHANWIAAIDPLARKERTVALGIRVLKCEGHSPAETLEIREHKNPEGTCYSGL